MSPHGTRKATAAGRHIVTGGGTRRDLADHIKLGPGGIREIEFIAQAFQLIRGGRDAGLQARATLRVLALLAERRILPEDVAAQLADSYVFLRQLEHRPPYFHAAP